MLDIKRIKENPEAVKAGLRAKEVDCDAQVDRILELDAKRRNALFKSAAPLQTFITCTDRQDAAGAKADCFLQVTSTPEGTVLRRE